MTGAERRTAVKIATKVLGKPLLPSAVVHHIDEDESNNEHSNLVVCEDQAYHFLLHQRTDALKACGHADWKQCNFCKKHDSPSNLRIYIPPGRNSGTVYHIDCKTKYDYERYRANLHQEGMG